LTIEVYAIPTDFEEKVDLKQATFVDAQKHYFIAVKRSRYTESCCNCAATKHDTWRHE